MVLNISGRTDIVAFYSRWFMNRYQEGYVDVRNPFYPKMISRIYFNRVNLIVFCTKNPLPIIPYLKKITQPILFQVTLTPYHKEIEPNVPEKIKIIEGIKILSQKLGKEKVYLRYDPIFFNNRYTIEYHIKAFKQLTELLDGYITTIIVSFLDEYKNVKNHQKELNYKTPSSTDYEKIGENFANIAKSHNMVVQTCFEKHDLTEYGFQKGTCVPRELVYQLTGKKYKKWQARKCNCAEMVDIGFYNTCLHRCKYCYANYNEIEIEKNRMQHNPNSSLLIGEIKQEDEIKERR